MDNRSKEQTRTAMGKMTALEATAAALIRRALAGERSPRIVVYADRLNCGAEREER